MSSATKALLASIWHPTEVAALLQYSVSSSNSSNSGNLNSDASSSFDAAAGNNSCIRRESFVKSYEYLNATSRSFARVIQELHPKLRHAVCIFYLVLRGLDTIEDDMSIPYESKRPLLLNFHKNLSNKGWNFTGNDVNEKDRMLLVEFHYIIDEFLSLVPEYQLVIDDITRRMGAGMSDFRDPNAHVITVSEYNLYCHYVAGLVGIGLTALFVNSGLESHPKLVLSSEVKRGGKLVHDNEYLSNRMGLFLQKTNIIKDFMEDLRDGRVFWPREVWRQYLPEAEKETLKALEDQMGHSLSSSDYNTTTSTAEIQDIVKCLARPENKKRAMACLNALVADALELVPDCLEYMSLLQEPSVFSFAAIPQVMAIASLVLFFNNSALFTSQTGLKIRRGQSVKLMLFSCKNITTLKEAFQSFVYQLHAKNHDSVGKNEFDKSFVKMAVSIGAIQRWLNVHTMQEYSDLNNRVSGSVMVGDYIGTRMALKLSSEMKRTWVDVWLVWAVIASFASFYYYKFYLIQ